MTTNFNDPVGHLENVIQELDIKREQLEREVDQSGSKEKKKELKVLEEEIERNLENLKKVIN